MDLLVSVSTSSATSFDSAAVKRWRGDDAAVGRRSLHDLPPPSFLWWHGGHHMLIWCTSPDGRTKEWSQQAGSTHTCRQVSSVVIVIVETTTKRHSTSLISESDSLVMLWFALTSWNLGLVGPPTSPSPASRPTQHAAFWILVQTHQKLDLIWTPICTSGRTQLRWWISRLRHKSEIILHHLVVRRRN